MIRRATRRWLNCAFLVLLALIVGTADSRAETASRVVAAKYWNCMIEHASTYGAIVSEPVIIFLALCPTVEPGPDDIAKTATNLGDVPDFGRSKISNVLVMSRKDLACVLKNPSRVAAPGKSDPTLGPLLEINLDACREK